ERHRFPEYRARIAHCVGSRVARDGSKRLAPGTEAVEVSRRVEGDPVGRRRRAERREPATPVGGDELRGHDVGPAAGALGARLAYRPKAQDVGGEAARHRHARVDERSELTGRLRAADEPFESEVERVSELPDAAPGEAGIGRLAGKCRDAID